MSQCFSSIESEFSFPFITFATASDTVSQTIFEAFFATFTASIFWELVLLVLGVYADTIFRADDDQQHENYRNTKGNPGRVEAQGYPVHG